MTHGRLEQYAAAVDDLRAALTHNPDLQQAPLELGVALLKAGQPSDAVPWLTQAQGLRDTETQASLFLGIAHLRLGEIAAAKASLIRAANADPSLDLPARYYQAVADYKQGDFARAQEEFSYVASTSPTSEMGREAAAFLGKISSAATHRRYYLYGIAGFQYDSNVVLAPSSEALKNGLGISNQADGRAVIEAGGTYAPLRTAHTELTLGYEFYQSLHFRIDRFNLQDHRPSVQLAVNAGPARFGILGRYDYYFLRTDSFLQEGTVIPWLTIRNANIGRTELFYRMRRRDFLKAPFSGLLDSFNHAVGFRQYFYLGAPEQYLALGYRYDREDPVNHRGDPFAYDGNELNVGIGWTFLAGLSAEAEYAYRHEAYDLASAQPAGSPKRADDEHQVVAAVHKDLDSHLRVTGAYLGTVNSSNKALFDYNRNVASLTLEMRF